MKWAAHAARVNENISHRLMSFYYYCNLFLQTNPNRKRKIKRREWINEHIKCVINCNSQLMVSVLNTNNNLFNSIKVGERRHKRIENLISFPHKTPKQDCAWILNEANCIIYNSCLLCLKLSKAFYLFLDFLRASFFRSVFLKPSTATHCSRTTNKAFSLEIFHYVSIVQKITRSISSATRKNVINGITIKIPHTK